MGRSDFLFIYFIKLPANFNNIFHKTTDERYFETRKTVQYYVWYNLGVIGILISGFVIALFYNPRNSCFKRKKKNEMTK
jgi:hypothetical protein